MEANSICGNIYHCKPLLIYEVVIYAFGSVIQIVSNITGELIGSFKQHTKIVTSIANTYDGKKIISSSIDGLIIIWDRDSFSEISRHEISSPVYNIIVPSLSKQRTYEDELYLVVGINHNNNDKINDNVDNKSNNINQNKKNDLDNYKLIAYDLKSKKIRRKVSHLRDAVQNISLITYHEEEFIIVTSNHKIFLWSIEEKKHIGSKICSTVGVITSITVINSKNVIITGHENGEITMWHNLISCLLNNNSQNNLIDPTNTIMHWHAHPVVAMSTSIDGEYLYSGGEEGVLVVWQLSTGIKSFIPRLGEAITHITSSKTDAKVIVTSKDNSIRIINLTTMKADWVLRSISIISNKVSKSNMNNKSSDTDSFNLQFPTSSSIYQADPSYKCKIAIENRTGYIVCNGYPGELQSLDMNTKSYRSSYEIVNHTRISKKDSISRMFVPSTTYFDFIHTMYGDFLITIDVQRGEDTDAESSLKFWEWSNDSNKYILNAQVDHPHNSYRVTCAVFCPFNLLLKDKNNMNYITCTTCCIEGTIKVWRGILSSLSNVGKSKIQWSCSYAFKHRDSPVQNISFSIDGSLLAVAQENTVTLWNPSHVELKTSIVGPITNNIIFTAFIEPKASIFQGGGNGQAMLVLGSKRSISVYNLITMTMLWTVQGRFSNFSVAKNEDESILFSNNERGWISVSSIQTKDNMNIDDEIIDENIISNNFQHSVLIFNPFNSIPLHIEEMSTKVISMIFHNSTSSSMDNNLNSSLSSSGIIIMVTQGCEIVVLGEQKQNLIKSNDVNFASISLKNKLPILSYPTIDSNNNSGNDGNLDDTNNINIKNGWLCTIFDQDSGKLASLSTIYDGFTGNFLKKRIILDSNNNNNNSKDSSILIEKIYNYNKNDDDSNDKTSNNKLINMNNNNNNNKDLCEDDSDNELFSNELVNEIDSNLKKFFSSNNSIGDGGGYSNNNNVDNNVNKEITNSSKKNKKRK